MEILMMRGEIFSGDPWDGLKFYWNLDALFEIECSALAHAKAILKVSINETAEHMRLHKTLPLTTCVTFIDSDEVMYHFERDEIEERMAMEVLAEIDDLELYVDSFSTKAWSKKIKKSSCVYEMRRDGVMFYYFFLLPTGNLNILRTGNERYAKNFMLNNALLLELPAACAWCGDQSSKLKTCKGCRETKYCSRDCQREHYEDGHKNCKRIMETLFGSGQEAENESSALPAVSIQSEMAQSAAMGALEDAIAHISLEKAE
jgi:hypothetical protein